MCVLGSPLRVSVWGPKVKECLRWVSFLAISQVHASQAQETEKMPGLQVAQASY